MNNLPIVIIRTLRNVENLIASTLSNPIASRHKLRVLFRILKWQIYSSRKKNAIYKWIESVRFYVKKGESGLTQNIYCGLAEYEEMSFLLHVLRPGDLFLDIGANSGSYTLLASGVCGADSISLEPIQDSYVRLTRNIELNGLMERVTALNYAAWSKHETLPMSNHRDTENSISLLKSNVEQTMACGIPVDTLVKTKFPTLVKIDVEGWELSVLRGMTRIVSESRSCAFVVEVRHPSNKNNQEAVISEFFRTYGYSRYCYDPVHRLLRQINPEERTNSQNAIFVRNVPFFLARIHSSANFLILGEVL